MSTGASQMSAAVADAVLKEAASPQPKVGSGLAANKQHSDEAATIGVGSPASLKCRVCTGTYDEPKVLACFHSFCRHCLVKTQGDQTDPNKVVCPVCNAETQLCAELGVDSLLHDYGLENLIRRHSAAQTATGDKPGSAFGSPPSSASSPADLDSDNSSLEAGTVTVGCTGCKSKDNSAVSFCYDCVNFLCENCVMAHHYMHVFTEHKVKQLADLDRRTVVQLVALVQQTATSGDGTTNGGPAAFGSAAAAGAKPVKCFQHRNENLEYFCFTDNIPICGECVRSEHPKDSHKFELIHEIAPQQLTRMERLVEQARTKQASLAASFKALDALHSRLTVSLAKARQDVDDTARYLTSMVEELRQGAMKQLEQTATMKQMQLSVLDKKVQTMNERLSCTIAFTDRQLRHASAAEVLVYKQLLETRLNAILLFQPDVNALAAMCDLEFSPVNAAIAKERITQAFGNVKGTGTGGGSRPASHAYEKWSSAQNDTALAQQAGDLQLEQHAFSQQNSLPAYGAHPGDPAQHVKRQKMIYHCKFGEFGILEGQFTEPSGVAVAADGSIVVADTNNHRIQVFDHDGRFKFAFGECGKRDSQLLYPNRVAVNRATGDVVVTERSPTHQIQVYNQYGQFLRKFGAHVLQHPRGVTVDSHGHIVVVECKVMRIIIFDMYGEVLQKFCCKQYLEFPNGVATNDRQEIFVSDNRAHCVKVFSYDGQYLRRIGGEGQTNYPIGVGINHLGQVVIADNHNNFNVTVYSQEGQMLSALESKVKHAQCFDMALLDDGSVVLASKDYRLYCYRYMNQTPTAFHGQHAYLS